MMLGFSCRVAVAKMAGRAVCLSLSKSWKDPQLSLKLTKWEFLCIIYWKLPGENVQKVGDE